MRRGLLGRPSLSALRGSLAALKLLGAMRNSTQTTLALWFFCTNFLPSLFAGQLDLMVKSLQHCGCPVEHASCTLATSYRYMCQ